MTNVYKRAYTEVLEILSHFSTEEYSKIPQKKIDFYKKYMDKEYIYKINPEMELSEQNISKETNAILISLFRDYFATEKQKETLNNLLNQNKQLSEREKEEKYNPNNIFKNKEDEQNNSNKEIETRLVEYKEPFFIKFVNFIKKLLRMQ